MCHDRDTAIGIELGLQQCAFKIEALGTLTLEVHMLGELLAHNVG
jgi:hypothetical protein